MPDLTQFYKQYKSIQPWLQSNNPPAQGEQVFQSYNLRLSRWSRCAHCLPPASQQTDWQAGMSSFMSHSVPIAHLQFPS